MSMKLRYLVLSLQLIYGQDPWHKGITRLYQEENLSPYFINDQITNQEITVAYELNKPVKLYNSFFWSGNVILNYKQICAYLFISRLGTLPTSVTEILPNKKFTLKEILSFKPLLIYRNNNQKKKMIFVFILDNIHDIILVHVDVVIMMQKVITKELDENDEPIVEIQKYEKLVVKNINIHTKQEFFTLFQQLTKYAVGMSIKNQDFRELKKLSVPVEITNSTTEYHICFYDPHIFGICGEVSELKNRKMVYFIFTINNKDNTITNIKLKTNCCGVVSV